MGGMFFPARPAAALWPPRRSGRTAAPKWFFRGGAMA